MDTEIRIPPVDAVLAGLASRQHGVVARRQLLAAGISSTEVGYRVRAGRLLILHRGVYAVGHRSLTRHGRWLAAVLAAGPGAALSHRDAAALHGLGDWNRGRIDVTTFAEVKATAGLAVRSRTKLVAADVTVVGGVPATTVSRTLVDLADVLSHERLAAALTAAERANAFDLRALEAARARVQGRHGPGHAALTDVLAEHAARGAQLTREELEVKLRRLVREHDLGSPRLNAFVDGEEVDACWPAARVIVEVDGWRWHRDRRAFGRDRAKTNRLQLMGWVVLRFTHDDVVRRPVETAAAIRRALAAAHRSAVAGAGRARA